MSGLRSNGWSILAFGAAAAVLAAPLFWNVELVKLEFLIPERATASMIDDLAVGVLLIAAGLSLDQVRRLARHRRHVEEQRLRVLQATMRTVQDIVNNFLHNLQFLRVDMERAPLFQASPELDSLINETTTKLRLLGEMTCVRETRMAVGVGIECPELPSGPSDVQ